MNNNRITQKRAAWRHPLWLRLQWNLMFDKVVKSSSIAFLLHGKRPFRRIAEWDALRREAGRRASKVRFSLSLQINSLRCKLLICAPVHGRDDDFVKSHHV